MASPTDQIPTPGKPDAGMSASAGMSAALSRAKRQAKEAEVPSRGRSPLEVIVVGAGTIAQQLYFPALRALQQTKAIVVRAIVDGSDDARLAATENFPDALRVGSVDAVTVPADALAIVSTPARFRAAHVNAALKRGWHVLCATPLAPSAHDGALMIAAAQRHERFLASDLRSRFFPAARYVRTLCHDYLLGPPLSFRVSIGQARGVSIGRTVIPGRVVHPDGVLADLGVHALDVLTWCLGSASIISYADDAMGGAEANAMIDLSFGEGVRGTIHLSHDWPTEDAYTFVFERGIVRWAASRANTVTLQLASAPTAIEGQLVSPLSPVHSHPSTRLLGTFDQACVAELENIIATIAGRENLSAPATEAMHSLPLIEECYARRTPLLQPWLTRNETAQARALCPRGALHRS